MNLLGRLRPEMRHFADDEEVDAVIIGTGAGGAPLLAKLAQAGLKVVALDAGSWWESPSEQFATDELDAVKIYWTDERLVDGDGPMALGGNNSGTGVGGSTLHWGAFVPRVDPRDLRVHSDFGESADWPLSYDDLLPFYEEVERFLGVSGPDPYPWDPSRRYPTGPVKVNAPGQLMQRGFAAMGLRAAEAPIAALSVPYGLPEYGERNACVNRGFCHQGCRNGAKGTMDVTYLPWAVKNGAEIRPNAMVHGFERDSHGNISAVLYRDSVQGGRVREGHKPAEHRLRCKHVFLCGGGIETPRLLLHTGLANGSGQVGKNFMAHVATQVWGTFEPFVGMNKGFPATVISEDTMRAPDAKHKSGYLVQSLGVVPVTWSGGVARSRGLFGKPLVEYLNRYNHIAGIGVNGDCLPHKDNFVELSDELDGNGLPKPIVHYSYKANELAMSEHAVAVMTEAWKAAGATDIWTLQRSAHTIGTCRMGASPDDSVVDPYGRSHEVPNLWVCDNSVFPSALAANPALTIMALSLRTAEHFLAEEKAGEKAA